MDRFAPRMAHNDVEARKEASLLMFNMLRIHSYSSEDWHKKVFLIQNYELVRTALSIMKNECSERVLLILFDIITLAVTKQLNVDQDCIGILDAMEDFSNVEISYLD